MDASIVHQQFSHHETTTNNNKAALHLQKVFRGYKARQDAVANQGGWMCLPILIIPGIASSGLRIEQSGLSNDKYAGARVWMNAAMLAASRMNNSNVLNQADILHRKGLERAQQQAKEYQHQAQQYKQQAMQKAEEYREKALNMVQARAQHQVRGSARASALREAGQRENINNDKRDSVLVTHESSMVQTAGDGQVWTASLTSTDTEIEVTASTNTNPKDDGILMDDHSQTRTRNHPPDDTPFDEETEYNNNNNNNTNSHMNNDNSETTMDDSATTKSGADAFESPLSLEQALDPFLVTEVANQVRSAWLHHLSLEADLMTERPGNRVRCYPGLSGCDYLSDDPMTKLGSWVHAPVVKFLTDEMGYVPNKDLDAAPYDWRIPPSVCQERDLYLTNTKRRIEIMYEDNQDRPVILLCHSMGCKMGHYLLTWLHQQPGGPEWIDKYIYAYTPVGAPHCGVSLAVRSGLTGKGLNDQVDMMMQGEDEGLVLYRSWGSGAWLMPRALPTHVIPSVLCRREGELAVKIVSKVNVGDLFLHRQKLPKDLRLMVIFRGRIFAKSSYQPVEFEDGCERDATVTFDESFYFAVPVDNAVAGSDQEILGDLQFFLDEPAGRIDQNPSELRRKFKEMTSWEPIRQFKKGITSRIRKLAKQVGTVYRVAVSKSSWELRALDFEDEEAISSNRYLGKTLEREIDMCCHDGTKEPSIYADPKDDDFDSFRSHESSSPNLQQPLGSLHVVVKYEKPYAPPNDTDTPIAKISPGESPTIPILPVKYDQSMPPPSYEVLSGHQIFEKDGFNPGMWPLLRDRYENDPVGPTTLSATEPPPVKRIRAIYGINLPTEVSAVYRHRPVVIVGDDLADSRYELDTNVKFPALNSDIVKYNKWARENLKDYKMVGGRILETPTTLQKLPIAGNLVKDNAVEHISHSEGVETRRCCGDGTVPYWNLSHVLKWKDAVPDLRVDELDKAEHRGILADRRFHELLRMYCIVKNPRTQKLLKASPRKQLERGIGGIGSLQAALQDSGRDFDA